MDSATIYSCQLTAEQEKAGLRQSGIWISVVFAFFVVVAFGLITVVVLHEQELK